MSRLLLTNGRVVDPSQNLDTKANVLIEDGVIAAIEPGLHRADAETIDCHRQIIAPGFIDVGARLNDPGRTDRENLTSAGQAAALGGFTSLVCAPNTSPLLDESEIVDNLLRRAESNCLVRVQPMGTISVGMKGETLSEMSFLAEAGCVAFSDYGKPTKSTLLLRRALEYGLLTDRVVVECPWDESLVGDGVCDEGPVSTRLGLPGWPAEAEVIAVSNGVILAGWLKRPLHFANISAAGSVEVLRRAQEAGVPVTASVTPHHLLFTADEYEQFDSALKVKPPLRSEADREALIAGVLDGTVGVLGSDHAPYAFYEKAVEFELAPFGCNGLQAAVSVYLSTLLSESSDAVGALVKAASTTPAKVFGLEGQGTLKVGTTADVTVLDPDRKVTFGCENWASKSKVTPYIGREFTGGPVAIIVGGRVVVQDGSLVGSTV